MSWSFVGSVAAIAVGCITNSRIYLSHTNAMEVKALIPKDIAWETLKSSVKNFSEDFLADRNQPEMQKRDDL